MTHARRPSTNPRRERILDAALDLFLELGYANATMAMIRERSGASIGSIYFFFDGKAAIASELMERAIAGWDAATTGPEDPGDAEGWIRASVHGLLSWARDHEDIHRFLEEVRTSAGRSAGSGPFRDRLSQGQQVASQRYAAWAAAGLVRELPWPVAYALMLGPAQTRLRSDVGRPSDEEIVLLVEAAWRAVEASPAG